MEFPKVELPKVKLWQEFKAFAFKGNMLDLAVGVVIGTAFGKVIDSLVKAVIMPSIGFILAKLGLSNSGYLSWQIGPSDAPIQYGIFLGELLNFLIIAASIFLIVVKVIMPLVRKPETPPAMKQCPLCLSTIPEQARKCAHCTADLPN